MVYADVEYTRSDIAQARISKLERIALAAEALAKACYDVFDNIDAVGTSEFYTALAAYDEATKN